MKPSFSVELASAVCIEASGLPIVTKTAMAQMIMVIFGLLFISPS
jgi:hypothetical protein